MSRKSAVQASLSAAARPFAVLSWLSICVVFWVVIARLVF
jgi:hypothetical protein